MSPPFSAGTQDYRVDVGTAVTDVTVSATKSDANAVLSGDVSNQGQATITLDGPGTTKVVSIRVTAPNGTSQAYTITIRRAAPSSDDNLSNLIVTPGSLDPDFAPGIPNYSGSVANDGSGDVLVGGQFTSYTGTPVGNIVRLNRDGSLD